MNGKPWRDTAIYCLKKLYPDYTAAEIARKLGRTEASIHAMAHKLDLQKSETFKRSSKSGRLDGTVGAASRFPKGHVPASAGTKGIYGVHPGCRATQFKKGRKAQEARNYVPIGSERITRDGYIERKVTDDPSLVPARRWTPVHRIVWQEAIGPIPPGHILRFINGDKADTRLENLELLTLAENARRNVSAMPKEIMDLHRLRGTLTKAINRRNRANEQSA